MRRPINWTRWFGAKSIATRMCFVAGKTKGAGAQSTAPRRPTGTKWKAEDLQMTEAERMVAAPKMETMSDEGNVSSGNKNTLPKYVCTADVIIVCAILRANCKG